MSEKVVPVREGLFLHEADDGRPKLLGSKDETTGEVFWPAERMNPTTQSEGVMTPAEIDGRGQIVSYTVVQRGLPGFPSPYALSVVQLDAGPSLIAQLTDWESAELRIGAPVDLVIGAVKTQKDGTVVEGPLFRIEEQGASA